MQQFQPLSHRIRVFVADSSPISSQLLAEAIAKDSGIEVVGFSSSPLEVVRITRITCPDVLLVSARMEEEPTRGLSLARHVREERPSLKIIVLLDSRKPDVVVRAFRSGASGVFCRSGELQLLLKSLVAVHRGQIWASSEELGFVLQALSMGLPVQFDGKKLTPLSIREKEVVRCLVEGFTNREIAETLAISQHTVKNYIFKIFDKMGVSNRVELAFQVLSGSVPHHFWSIGPSDVATPHVQAHEQRRAVAPILGLASESFDGAESQFPRVPQRKEVSVAQSGSTAFANPMVMKAAGRN